MKKWILVLLTSLLAAGCTGKFVYDNLDWLVIDYLEDFVELNDEQELALSDKIATLSSWHREQEVPKYVQHIDQLLRVEPASFSLQDLKSQQTLFQQHGQRLLNQIEPNIFDLATLLSDEQTEELMNSIRVRHTKYKKKYQKLDDEEIRENYAERIEESFENWLGSLERSQKQLVSEWTKELYITSYDWIEHQTKMRIELKTLLAKRASASVFNKSLQPLLFNPTSFYSDELNRKVEHNKAVGDRYTVAIINSMTEKQTRHFREELQDWRDIADDLL
ncbi:DUF6279 family lipoprotein [Vibrio sonorensis]|uniref:DUF6279 family lipoprotein n=1 Tax=Vibrio sonorensis TaxID=1004316 RepID=UPI0008DA5AD7|nr:DUF6279 family lipoprotein [Vibrio sonorensis]